MDVTDLSAMQTGIASLPALDVLVNNAGTNRPAPFLEAAPSDFDHVMAINVRAAFFVAQAVARKMSEERRAGSIINISSQMGLVGGAGRSVYCASKWAMEGFTKAAAVELGAHGIRVNTICPTFIETPMTRPFLAESGFLAAVLKKIKLGRLGSVEDIMGAVVFLASDASSLMTGSALVLDGGWTAD
jgi:NAD(P)-dependent dehydrogenase (short-subunit alcohol dehydrogenase family)